MEEESGEQMRPLLTTVSNRNSCDFCSNSELTHVNWKPDFQSQFSGLRDEEGGRCDMGVGDIDNDVLFTFYPPFALLFEQKVLFYHK